MPDIESSLTQGFVKPREFIKKLLVRIQGTRHLVRYTGKFVISGVRYARIQLQLAYVEIGFARDLNSFGTDNI